MDKKSEQSEVEYDDDFEEEQIEKTEQTSQIEKPEHKTPIIHEEKISTELSQQEQESNPKPHLNTARVPRHRRIETERNFVTMTDFSMNHLTTQSPAIAKMANITSDINGWNLAASKTVANWYNVFREYGYVYQYVLDTNQRMASRLNMVSTISSSTLGIFSAFKLWMNDEQTFRVTSDIILMMFNFGIAMLTTASKRYLDDARNEKIRTYIEDVDKFIGEISAQLLKMPEFRMNAKEFLNKHNDTYTKLITQQPSLSNDEITEGKKLYKKYLNNRPEKSITDVTLEIKTRI